MRHPTLVLALGLAVLPLLPAAPGTWSDVGGPDAVRDAVPPRHFELERSLPAGDTTVSTAPDRIQLWFTQAPQLEGARIRLVKAGGALVATGEVAAADDDPTSLHTSVEGPVTPGRYTIHWRAMARDGHIVSGEIPFAVAGATPAQASPGTAR